MRVHCFAVLFAVIAAAPLAAALAREERPLDQRVREAKVIVVATALDAAPAPPNRPGDPLESAIRFRVTRLLKGELDREVITLRTPTAAEEFIGKAWVVMLSPDFVAGKHSYASCWTIKLEPEVKAILSRRSSFLPARG